MRHALFVTFQYPPDASSSGVLRTLKYTRYLAEHGWRVTVLSIATSAYETVDEQSRADIPPGVRVVRTPYLDTRRHLSLRGRYLALMALPDRFVGWLPWAVAEGARIAAADPVDLVYSTSPPATAHLVAWRLARRLRKPWVADFRDPWFEDPPEPGAPAGRLFRGIDRRLEAAVVAGARHVVASTESLRDQLAARYPRLDGAKFGCIPNGYDEADFAQIASAPTPRPTPAATFTLTSTLDTQAAGAARERLAIVHAGSINPDFRDPVPLVHAIARAHDRGLLDADRIRLMFLGGGAYADSPALAQALAASGLAGIVEMLPRRPYAQALAELARADVLLLLQASEDTRSLVPAKLYEYLRMGRPVLALTLPGESSALLGRTGGGVAVDPADAEALVEALAGLYRHWQNGTLGTVRADPARLARYERRALAAELAEVFARAV